MLSARQLHKFLHCLSPFALLGLLSCSVSAQDFYRGGVTAETSARAGVYTPGGADVLDALVLNPAGLSALQAPTANTILAGGLAYGDFSNAANPDSAMRRRPGFIPYGAIGAPLGSRWSGGLAIAPDFVSTVNWHYTDSPGTGGADYGSQAEKSSIAAYRAVAGLAYALTPRVSVGATGATVYNENALVTPFIFQSNPSLKGLKTLLALHTRGFGWGGSVGLAGTLRRLTWNAAWNSPVVISGRGHAAGSLAEQFAVLAIPFAPDFTYSARVRVKLPQSLLLGGRWQATPTLGIGLQGDFANFHSAFDRLPVHLTKGSNSDINGFLGSTGIDDEVPLHWSNQYTARIAADRSLGEHFQWAGGYTRRSSLVPNGTLTPLTAAIMKNGLSTGLTYRRDHLQLAAAYEANLDQSATVGISGLQAGEYSHSQVTIGSQELLLGLSVRLPH